MADYRYVVADLKTGTVRDEVPFTGVTYGQQLSGAAPFSATAPVDLVTRTVQTRLYDAMIFGDRPNGYWRMGDAEGDTIQDRSGNGYDGTVAGVLTFGVDGAIADDTDTAIERINGTTGVVDIESPGAMVVDGTAYSYELWFHATTTGTNHYVIAESPDSTYKFALSWSSTTMRWYHRRADGSLVILEEPLALDEWHYIAVTYDGATRRMYVNGEEVASGAADSTYETASARLRLFSAAHANQAGATFALDEVANYNRALTAGAVKRHYDRGLLDPKRVTRTHRPLEAIEAARSIVYVERGGIVVGDGIVWDPRKDPGSRDLICQGAGLASYLSRRRIRNTRDYQGVDLGLIAKDLVDWAQGAGSLSYGTTAGPAEGDIGIDTSQVVAVGTTHFRTWPGHERKGIGDALGELDALEDGLDWWIGVEGGGGTFDRVMRVWHPRRERITDLVYEWGTNLDDYGVSHQGSKAANLVDAIGQGEGVDMKVATRQDAAALTAYPRLDDVLAMKDVDSTSDLAEAAGEAIRRRSTPPIVPALTLRVGPGTRYGMWALGDRVRGRIDDGWVQVDGLFRVVAWQVTVNDAHDETVTLTVEAA